MKTQQSRNSFDANKRYSGVYQQMGRMLLDADWNELSDIHKQTLVRALGDIIGSGTPRDGGVVELEALADGRKLVSLFWGDAYVDGVPAQLRPDPAATLDDPLGLAFEYLHQADFPGPPALPGGDYTLYLDVWERAVLGLEDGALRDPALHGADTCTRSQTMAQVKWCPLGVNPEDADQNPAIGDARLTLTLREGSSGYDPCDPCAETIATGVKVGNYLFRVEVHAVEYDGDGLANRLILKWSSENGAEQYALGNLPTGFVADKWVYEFFSGADQGFASEKQLGRHLNGFAPVTGQLSNGYPDSEPAGFANVRRWDGQCELTRTGDDWGLAAGGLDKSAPLSTEADSASHGHVGISAAVVTLSLENLTLQLALADKHVLAGDYWAEAVREDIYQAGDVILDAALPQGIEHHYLGLASMIDGELIAFDSEDCKRFEFPRLTDIQAADVCYENSACNMPNVDNVQEALDYLCRERDLRWHNKHLHGWGIVCGLIAKCGADTYPVGCGLNTGELDKNEEPQRRQVLITKGYALTCDGEDVVLDDNLTIDVMSEIEKLDAITGKPLLREGRGSVCLRIDLNEDGLPVIGVEAYDKEKHGKSSILDGTLLMDFIQCCVIDLIDAIRAEFKFLNQDEIDTIENGATGMVSAERRKFTAVLNLIYQLFKTQHGRYIFLSYREHLILRDLYRQLRCVLQSATFCGMFQDENFPDYPFPESGMTTIFGKNFHTRIKVHPQGNLLYSYAGDNNTINVYDLQKRQLVEVLEMPLAKGAIASAITFSADGKRLYACGSVNQVDTVFGVARIDDKHRWENASILCNINITEMEAARHHDGLVYAVGKERGLYFLNAKVLQETNKPRPQPVYLFNASGHLQIDADQNLAYCTVLKDGQNRADTSRYNAVVICDLSRVVGEEGSEATAGGYSVPPQGEIALTGPQGKVIFGSDGIALRSRAKSAERGPEMRERIGSADLLYVVVEDVDGKGDNKLLLTYSAAAPGRSAAATPDGYVAIDNTGIALAYHPGVDRVLLTLEDSFRVQVVTPPGSEIEVDRLPVQIQPVDVVYAPEGRRRGEVYVLNYVSNTISVIPMAELRPDSTFLQQLEAYRNRILALCYDLFGNVLQYLKDCFCNHFLVKCPSCDGDEVLYLANVEIRDNQVYRICNFDKRKYVKSFPMMDYWLSLVPVIPMVKSAFSQFCCWVLPDLFNRGKLTETHQPAHAYQDAYAAPASTQRKAISTFNRTDIKGTFSNQFSGGKVMTRLARDGALDFFNKRRLEEGAIGKQSLIDSSVPDAKQTLAERQIEVVEVEVYDPQQASRYSAEYLATPQHLPSGSKVKVVERDGKVAFYTTEKLAPESTATGKITDVSQPGSARGDKAAAEIRVEDSEVAALNQRVEGLKKARQLEAEQLEQMNATRLQMQKDLDAMQKSLQDMQVMQKQLESDVARGRPVSDLSSVDSQSDARLREAGVRTVAELAGQTPAALAKKSGVSRDQASAMIKEAKSRTV